MIALSVYSISDFEVSFYRDRIISIGSKPTNMKTFEFETIIHASNFIDAFQLVKQSDIIKTETDKIKKNVKQIFKDKNVDEDQLL